MVSNLVLAAPHDQWVGKWNGNCTITPEYDGIKQLKSSLEVKIQDKGLSWLLIYDYNGAIPTEVRNYELKIEDEKAGHYVIDEKNGLLLDAYLNNGVLFSPFTINGLLITARYEFKKSTMTLEMPSYGVTPHRTTCLKGNSDLCAVSLPLHRVQTCKMTKIK